MLLAIFLARALGPEGYGIIGLAITIAATVSVFLEVRVGEAVIKFATDYRVKGDLSQALAMIRLGYLVDLLSGLVSFLILFAIAPWAAETVMHRPEGANLIRIYALVPLITYVTETSAALLSIFERFRLMSLLQVARAVLRFALPLMGTSFGLPGVLWGYVSAELLPTIGYLAAALGLMRRHFVGVKAAGLLAQGRTILPFSLHTTLSTSFKSLTRYFDVLILGYFRTPAEVGHYRIALAGGGLLGTPAGPVGTAIYPRLSQRWAAGQRRQGKELTVRVSAIMAGFSVPGAVVLSLMAPWALPLLVGPGFGPALPAFYILIWGVAANNVICWARPFALASGRPELSTWANLLGTLVIVGANLALVPGLGIVGAAWAFLAMNLVVAAFYGFLLLRA